MYRKAQSEVVSKRCDLLHQLYTHQHCCPVLMCGFSAYFFESVARHEASFSSLLMA